MIGTPLLRNPMTESYVPGSWLWRMVLVLPLVVIFATYAVSIMPGSEKNFQTQSEGKT